MAHTYISTTRVGLNLYESTKHTFELKNFYKTLDNNAMLAGDLFVQNIIIRGLDMVMDTSLLNVNDICNTDNLKLIINKIYNNPLKTDGNFDSNTHAIYFNDIIDYVGKNEFIKNCILNVEYKKDKLKNVKDMFHLFVDILYGFVLLDCDDKYSEYGSDDDINNNVIKYYKFMDATCSYVSPNYNYDDNDNDSISDSISDSDSDNDSGNINNINNNDNDGDITNKRKFENIPISNPNKKPKC